MMSSTQYGISQGYTASDRDYINGSYTVTVNDAGPGGNYGMNGSQRIAFGLGIDLSDPSLNQGNIVSGGNLTGNNYVDGAIASSINQGIPANSVGTSINQTFPIAANAIDQSGSTFNVTFESQAEMWVGRNSGNADARFGIGPGMAGNADLQVLYEIWIAVPEPSSALLGVLGSMLLCTRRRR